MSSTSPRRRRARAAGLVLAAALASSCADDSPSVPLDRAGSTATTRLVLAPTAGALQVRVQGVGEPDDLDDVMLVGDSVMVLIADDLGNEIDATLHVDAADCRRLDRGFTGPCGGVPAGAVVTGGVDAVADEVTALASEGITADAAVLVLANNAAVTDDDLDAAMAAAPDVARVWWVTARVADHGYQDPNNRALFALAERNGRAGVIDWFDASEGHPEWFADGVHPNEAGQVALAALIAAHLRCDCTP